MKALIVVSVPCPVRGRAGSPLAPGFSQYELVCVVFLGVARAHCVLSRVHPSGHRHDRGSDPVGGASLEAVQGGGDPLVGTPSGAALTSGQSGVLLIGQLDVEGAEVTVELGEAAQADDRDER
ncbi:hypothetical protein [Streptomyces sp. WAC 01529]|uniref:hypothetical protein n=1 Tax=Streptomyces sp. WAC 01529 TaxID=2203205 RepID=UPI0013DFC970|nr:hypothetical protein [Streptomyces sp. WAC 01529]